MKRSRNIVVTVAVGLMALASGAAELSPLKAFKYYRLSISKVTGTDCLQLAEIALYDAAGNRVNQNLVNKGNVSGTDWVTRLSEPNTCTLWEHGAAGTTVDGKHATQDFFDGDLDSKGLIWSIGKVADGDDSTWPAVIMRLADDAPAVAAYNLATGNDNAWSETSNGRTVTGWALDASDDGVTWLRLDRQTAPSPAVPSPVTDKTWYNGGQPMAVSGSQRFVAPGDTLAINRSMTLLPPVNNGSVSIADGVTARFNVAAGDLDLLTGGALVGAGALAKCGAGELRLGGDNRAFAGKVAAEEGVVRFVDTEPLRAWTYYRLALRKKNGGNTSDQFELGEIGLYDAGGNRLNLNLANKGNSQPVGSLTASSFTYVENGAWASGAGANEAPEKMFDGDLSTKMYSGGFKPTEGKCPCVVMRLADGAPAVAAYRIGSGNDVVGCPNRQIVSWSLEGSDDGATWTTLHAVDDDPRMKLANAAWMNGGNAYPVMVRQGGCKAKYYRFSVTGLYACGGYEGLQFSELALYDALGARVNLGITYKGENVDVATLAAGEATFVKNGHSAGGEGERTDKLFDGNTSTKAYYSGTDYGEGKALQIVMRLTDDAPAVAGYNICSGNDDVWAYGADRCRTMGSWTLEASDDGVTWMVLAAEVNSSRAVIANTTWFNHGAAMACAPAAAAGDGSSAPAAATVSASNGATVVLPATSAANVGGLEIDCTAAAGTLENVRAASGLKVNLVNFRAFLRQNPGTRTRELPVAFAGDVDLGDLSTARVSRDGVASGDHTLSFADGKLRVTSPGLLVIVK